MLKKVLAFLILLATLSLGKTISENTGLVVTDSDGKEYDIDAILASGTHIVVHQTGST